MSIAERAMVLNLQISFWSGCRLDKEASRKVTDEANAEDDAARVNKHLIPKEALKPIANAAGAVRAHFYTKTLPWKDNGDRLLTRSMYMKFIEEHEALAARFRAAVQIFVDRDYPAAVDQASFRMGGLFNLNDYPAPHTIQRRFHINIDVDAVTEASDFRVQMGADEIDDIKSSMTKAMEDRISRALYDLWTRLHTTVEAIAGRLDDEDKVFRKTTLTNLEELVDMLPGLNITDDQELEQIRQQIKLTLTGHDPQTLRKDKAARATVVGDAKRIMETMAGFMNAFNKEG